MALKPEIIGILCICTLRARDSLLVKAAGVRDDDEK